MSNEVRLQIELDLEPPISCRASFGKEEAMPESGPSFTVDNEANTASADFAIPVALVPFRYD